MIINSSQGKNPVSISLTIPEAAGTPHFQYSTAKGPLFLHSPGIPGPSFPDVIKS
jgi:hypothetical protein